MSKASRFVKPFRVDDGRHFRLKAVDPGDTGGLESKERAQVWLERGVALLAEMQEKLYAQDRWAVLLIFQAYEDMIRNTATAQAPWYVVPADHKWFTRLVVAAAIVDALEELGLVFPKVDGARKKRLEAARAALEGEGGRD